MSASNQEEKHEDPNKDVSPDDLGEILGQLDEDNLDMLLDFEDEEEDQRVKQELLVGYQQEALEVEGNDINPEVRGQYTSANTSFILWLFDHGYQDLFEDGIWREFQSKFRKRNASGFEDVREAIRTYLTKREICPIKLTELQYSTFFTYICSIKRDDGTYFSFSCYEGKKTSLSYLFKSYEVIQSEAFKLKISKAFRSLRKTIKREETKLGKKQSSGKDVMTFKCYKFLCSKLLATGLPEDIFALCFLTLQWNLMSRSESTEALTLNNMRWEEDHMKVYFPKHKSDQHGLTSSEPRHVYSNPLDPNICPIRALGAYLIAFPDILNHKHGRLYPGESQKKRFGKQLGVVLKRHYHEFQEIGCDANDIGTHSIRKGAATYCTCACHPGPPIVSVCLRAGWTLGRVKERYLKYDAAGDQLVGRCLSGIHPQNKLFSISPVFFYKMTQQTKKQMKQLVTYCFPVDRPSFTYTATMLVANMIHCESFIFEKVKEKTSVLRDNNYFTYRNVFPGRLHHIRTACPWDNVKECPSFSGIPLHCSILNKLIEVHEMQQELPEQIHTLLKQELDERQIGSVTSQMA